MNAAEAKYGNGARIVTDDGVALGDSRTLQGLWTEAQYLRLTDGCNHRIEFTDGQLELQPMPTDRHQSILKFLFRALLFVEGIGGVVHFAALRLRVRAGKFREPDLLLLLDAADPRRQDEYWLGADLVLEVVSPDNPARELVEKRADYAEANIPEYWIVNPMDETLTVLVLVDGQYAERGLFRRGQQARSSCLPDFSVAVAAVFDAGKQGPDAP
ncbi:MAG: Uma2 family endonuclease [Gammaproteobacteria bacterium]|nr:Uma2 family endonuclease [Gammaproteobacteria bacterium]